MVERNPVLDLTFGALSDPTRRDILHRLAREELSVGAVGQAYDLTFAAVSKHVKVLEHAKLVTKERKGKLFLVRLAPEALIPASDYLQQYKELWDGRLDALEAYLKTMQ